MLISVLSAPPEPNLTALEKLYKTRMRKSVIGQISAYLMSCCNVGFRKRPRSCPSERASQIRNQLKKYLLFIG